MNAICHIRVTAGQVSVTTCQVFVTLLRARRQSIQETTALKKSASSVRASVPNAAIRRSRSSHSPLQILYFRYSVATVMYYSSRKKGLPYNYNSSELGISHPESQPHTFSLWHRIQAVIYSANCCTHKDVDSNVDDAEEDGDICSDPTEVPPVNEVQLDMAPFASPHPDSQQRNCKSEVHREAVMASLSSTFTSPPPQKSSHIHTDGISLQKIGRRKKSSLKSARPLSVIHVRSPQSHSDTFPGFQIPPSSTSRVHSTQIPECSSPGSVKSSPRFLEHFHLSGLICKSPFTKSSQRGSASVAAQELAPELFHSPVPSPTSNSIYYRAEQQLEFYPGDQTGQFLDLPISTRPFGQEADVEDIDGSYFIEVPILQKPPKAVEDEDLYPLERLFEGGPRSSLVGGVISNLLKLFVRRKMVSCVKVQVSIGGNSLQLLSGKSTGFRVYMQNFCFEGAWTTEAEAHTLGEAKVIFFDMNSARLGGKLFSERVPMMLSLRTSQEDANQGLKPGGNTIVRNVLQECWNHMNGHPIGSYPGGEATQGNTPGFPLPLPTFLCKFTGGLGLFAESFEEESAFVSIDGIIVKTPSLGEGKVKMNGYGDQKVCHPKRMALKFLIEKVDGREQLVVVEVDWPDAGSRRLNALEAHCRWRKVVDLPADIKFDTCVVDNGWFSYSYAFNLDL